MKKVLLILFCLILVGCSFKFNNDQKIKRQVIYEKDGIKVFAESLRIIDGKPILDIYAENKSKKDIIIQVDYLLVNDFMTGYIFSMNVDSKNKSLGELKISKEDLDRSEIDIINSLEFNLVIIDPNDWSTIDIKENIKLETNSKEVSEYKPKGDLIFSPGVNIYVDQVDYVNSLWGVDLYFYLENNLDEDISITASNVFVNGKSIEAISSMNVPSNKKAFTIVGFKKEDLDKNNIDIIKEVELNFTVVDMNTMEELFTTDKIKIKY